MLQSIKLQDLENVEYASLETHNSLCNIFRNIILNLISLNIITKLLNILLNIPLTEQLKRSLNL